MNIRLSFRGYVGCSSNSHQLHSLIIVYAKQKPITLELEFSKKASHPLTEPLPKVDYLI